MFSNPIWAIIFILAMCKGCVVPPPPFECGPNQEYFDGCGSACPPFCNMPEGGVACTRNCVSGCFCKSGYVLESRFSKKCILEEDCPKPTTECGPNKEYTDCGTACPAYCNEIENSFCIQLCVPGCFCKKGYVLESKNSTNCILTEDCPKLN